MSASAAAYSQFRYRHKNTLQWSAPVRYVPAKGVVISGIERLSDYDLEFRNVSGCGASSEWVPADYTVPSAPSPAQLAAALGATGHADGVTLDWSDGTATRAGLQYELQRAPATGDYTEEAPPEDDDSWVRVAIVGGSTWHDAITDTAHYWYRIRALSYSGGPGPWSILSAPAAATMSTSELAASVAAEFDAVDAAVAVAQTAVDAVQDQADGLRTDVDAEVSARTAQVAALTAQVEVITGQVGDILHADAWDSGIAYPDGEMVQDDGHLYRAVQDVPAGTATSDTDYWQYIGDYASLGEAVGATAATVAIHEATLSAQGDAITANTSDIASLVTDVAGKASTSALTALSGTVDSQGDAITANTSDIASLVTDVAGKASTSALTALSGTVDSEGDAITANTSDIASLVTDVAGKASTSALTALSGTVDSQGDAITANTSDIASLVTDVAGKASTSALTALSGTVDSQGDAITANTSDIASLVTDVAGKASTSALTALSGTVDSQGDAITANTSDIASLVTDVAGKASTSALTALSGTVDSQGDAITANTSDIASLVTDVAGKASTSALSALSGMVDSQGDAITANASSITSVKAALDVTRRIANPGFEEDTGWTLDSSMSFYSSDPHSGTRGLRRNGVAGTPTTTAINDVVFAVKAGSEWLVRHSYQTVGTTPNVGAKVGFGAQFRKVDGTLSANQYFYQTIWGSAWADTLQKITTPTDAVTCMIFAAFADHTSGSFMLDDFSVEPVDPDTAINATATELLAADVDAVTGKVNASYTLSLDVNGRVVGTVFQNDGTEGTLTFSADKINFVAPTGVSAAQWDAVSGTIYLRRSGADLQLSGGSGVDSLVIYYGATRSPSATTLENSVIGLTPTKYKLGNTWGNDIAGWYSGGDISFTTTTTSATIDVDAGVYRIGDQSISYGSSSKTVSGTGTHVYYLYYIDAGMAGGSRTLNASTDPTVSYAHSGYVTVGEISVTFSAGGSGSAGPRCVWRRAWVIRRTAGDGREHVRAGRVCPGDWLLLTDGSWGRVYYSAAAWMPSVRLETAYDALSCSRSAQIEQPDGRYVSADLAAGQLVVCGPDWPRSREVVAAYDIGMRWVQVLSIEGPHKSFWAGDRPGWMVGHHNMKPVQPL